MINDLTDIELGLVISLFFETSTVKEFSTTDAKELFLYRYFGYYQENFSDSFFVAFDDDEKILGYLCGHDHTFEDEALKKLQVATEYFEEVREMFPAHLHVNVSEHSRGRGVGSFLMKEFEAFLINKNIFGFHIITTPFAKNTHFYRKNGFEFELSKKVGNAELLCMAKSIKSSS